MVDKQPSSSPFLVPEFKWEPLPDDVTIYDLSFKLIVIGEAGVGKSSLTNKATKNTFDENYNATVGFEFFSFNLKINDKIIKLQIWDTCGQELYRSLITNFYRNSSLAIMVYAINSHESYDNIDAWLKELKTHSSPDAKVFLIGNKADLENERQIPTDQAEAYAKQFKFDLFMESSAKTGFNAQQVFVEAAKILYDDYLKYKDTIEQRTSSISSFKQMNTGNEVKTLNPEINLKEKKCAC